MVMHLMAIKLLYVRDMRKEIYQQTVIETKYDDSQKCYIKKYPESRKEYNLKIKEYDCKLVF